MTIVRLTAGLFLTRLCTLLPLLGGAQKALAQPPATTSLRATLTTDKPSYFIGEDVVVTYCVENTSAIPFDERAMPGYGFKPVVTNAAGVVMKPRFWLFGGIVQSISIAPGGRWCSSFSLMQFARIDRSDDYAVRASLEFLSGSQLTPGDAPDARVTLTLTMPTEAGAEVVLAAQVAQQSSVSNVGDYRNRHPYGGVWVYPAPYLVPLRNRAEAGDVDAVNAIARMSTPAATRALIDLTGHPLPAVARAATFSLPGRLPPAYAGVLGLPQLGGELGSLGGGLWRNADLAVESWRSDFTRDVRALAKELLTSSDAVEVRTAAFMFAAVGVEEDVPDIAAALTRTIAQPPTLPGTDDWSQPRAVAQELQRAATALVGRGYTPSAIGQTSGEVVLWLIALGGGSTPSAWEVSHEQALTHDVFFVREVAIDHTPLPVPPSVVPAIISALGARDSDLQVAACRLADRAKLSEIVGPVTEAFRGSGESRVVNACGNALHTLGARMEMLDIAASRLAEPPLPRDLTSTFLDVLYGVFEATSGGGGQSASPDQARVLSTRWQQFLARHRADIVAGRRWSLDDPDVTADLIPPGWSFSRPGKPDWPPR